MAAKTYAAYRGDELLGVGTRRELAELLGVTVGTVRYYSSPAYLRRRTGANKPYVFVMRVE